MIIKLKRESTKKCLNRDKFSLYKFFQIYFFFIFFFLIKLLNANECASTSPLKIGLIDNDNIDYQHYLYYELGNYAAKKNLEFEIEIVKNNSNKFDIIFGEYFDLIKLSQNEINYPKEVQKFYIENGIKILNNTLPLDLDTFIIVSNNVDKKINSLEELYNYYDPIRYTLGMNLKSDNYIAKIIGYNTEYKEFNFQSVINETLINYLGKTYKNLNKNILSSNFFEVYNSYENDENVYTLFSDGVLLNKNFDYITYQLFPQTKYKWDDKKGIFVNRLGLTPLSYYGFSAYINKTNQFGFLCHMIKKNIRKNSFKNFNIALSPLSVTEIEDFDFIPEGYLEILKNKNKNILDINFDNYAFKSESLRNIIYGNEKYQKVIDTNNYLNK